MNFIAGKQAINPENEARGALKAGYEYHSLSQLQVAGFRYQDDTTFNANQKELFENNYQMRKSMNVITDEEVKDLIAHHINKINSDIQVMFLMSPYNIQCFKTSHANFCQTNLL